MSYLNMFWYLYSQLIFLLAILDGFAFKYDSTLLGLAFCCAGIQGIMYEYLI